MHLRTAFVPNFHHSSTAGEGFRIGFQQTNTTPINLASTALLAIPENQLIGTVVGEFNATDPDANSTLTYYLVSGVGDGNNSLFTLETNGTLKTATVFDYESNASTYTIRVQARDDYNSTVEDNFTVALIDVYEDTDGDGFRDSLEASTGSDLNDPNSTPLQQGLVAWYPFDGNASDMSGNFGHGSVVGATLGDDRFGRNEMAYYFDGINDRVRINDQALNGKLAYSLSMWIKPLAGSTHFFSGANNSYDNEYLLAFGQEYELSLSTKQLGGTSGILHKSSFSTKDWFGNWVQLILTREGPSSSINIFANGKFMELFSSASGAPDISPNGLWIGADQDSVGGGWDTGNYLNGFLDDIRIYDRALSADEIRLLYRVEAELPELSVTSAKLSPALSDLIDGNGSLEHFCQPVRSSPASPVKLRRPATHSFNAMNTTPLSSGKRRHR